MDMWLQDCFETCIHTDGCEGVVVTRKLNSVGQQGSAPCYLRKGIDAQASHDSHNDLYVYNGQDGGSVGSSSFLGASGGRVFGTQGIETFLVLGLIALAVILLLAWWFLRRRKRQLLQDPLNE
ncbi:unnamed protein product [Prorocentrum cordatum]|uniref:Apple domain-containing protein n=1 Tax=Prorocentrum cordatum TaxID=2364126 RepID=A0ABN9Q3Q3_9DINO|nr:unnamed protein product [Polarella glacialis]